MVLRTNEICVFWLCIYILRVGEGDARMGTTQQAGLASSWVNSLHHTAEKNAVFCVIAISSVRSSTCNSEARAMRSAWQALN